MGSQVRLSAWHMLHLHLPDKSSEAAGYPQDAGYEHAPRFGSDVTAIPAVPVPPAARPGLSSGPALPGNMLTA